MRRKLIFSAIIAALLLIFSSTLAQSNTGEERRIMEPITVNGQATMGVIIVKNGTLQTYSCSSPQPYVTQDRSETGWACPEQTTGMWLLHAEPPSYAAEAAQESPAVIYSEPDTTYVPSYSYWYGYPYGYYSYPYLWAPGLGFGFGFNFGHGFHEGHGFGHRGFHGGGFNHAGPGFNHGGGFHGGGFHGHMGGGHMGGGHMGGGHR
jgi:hypothetical protein